MWALILLQVVLAWFYSHFIEYILHRYVLHNRKLSPKRFKDHFSTHHSTARRNLMLDAKYVNIHRTFWRDDEVRSLFFLSILHSPIVMIWPWAYLTLVLSAISYFLAHRKSHLDHDWARNNLPWHYDHHMGKNQHKNWGVRLPIFDYIFGTRSLYKGQKKEIVSYMVKRNLGGMNDYVKARSRRFEREEHTDVD